MRNTSTAPLDPSTRPLEEIRASLLRYSTIAAPDGTVEEQRWLETDRGRVLMTSVIPAEIEHTVAFLLCHSFGFEQFELFPLELRFARAAARAGFVGVCFQARGYGDADGSFADVTPSGHVADAAEVASSMLGRHGIRSVVPVGVRFGAYVAWRVAGSLGSPGAALWNPSLSPVRYLDGILKALVRTRMMSLPSGHPGRMDTDMLRERLLGGNSVDLFGYPLTSACYADAQRLPDALGLPDPFPQRVHLVVINPRNRREVDGTRARLEGRGVQVAVDELEEEGCREFALGVPIGGHLATHARLFDAVGRSTLRWASGAW